MPVEPRPGVGYHATMAPLLQEPTMDRLIRLPERQALRVYFDNRNCRILYRQLLLFSLLALLVALWLIAHERYLALLVPAVNLGLIRLLYSGLESERLERHFLLVSVTFLGTQYLLLRLLFLDPSPGPLDFFFPLLLAFYRLPRLPLFLLLITIWGFASRHYFLADGASNLLDPSRPFIAQSLLSLGVFFSVSFSNQGLARDLLARHRLEARRERERRRMREELGDARRIQLSMLPKQAPKISWLDVAGLSIPASEVGGDYYNYFSLSDTRFAVVIADVAGHGMAGGLVLSGIRACLHLLHEETLEPAQILERLDRVVRETSGSRLFVTMLYAIFDLETRTVTAAAAGHPPLVCFRHATADVISLGAPALPLGTSLPKKLQQQQTTFEKGDVFLFYTDGIAETANRADEAYGTERLEQKLISFATDRNATAIREALLGDVVTWKSDREQTDDITVVVLRIR